MAQIRYRDSEWVKQAFMLLSSQGDATDRAARIATTANYKFVDSSLGGSFVINPLPQYTYIADPKRGGASPLKPDVERASPSQGIGRYFSEAHDDHYQVVTMRFGVPQFNSLWSFYGAAVNGKAALLAKTGRGDQDFFAIGKAAAYTVATAIGGIPMFLYQVYRFFTQKPVSRYYYLKPAMPLYWNAVTSMLNTLAVNMGIAPYAQTDQQQQWFGSGGSDNPAGGSNQPDASVLAQYAAGLPGIFMPDGRIDVYAMATKAQRVADLYYRNIQNIIENNSTFSDIQNALKQFQGSNLALPTPNYSLVSYIAAYFGITSYSGSNPTNSDSGDAANPSNSDGTSDTEAINQWSDMNSLTALAKAELEDGASFVSFRVDATGPVSESFSNQIGESDVSQKANSVSAQARSAQFDLAGGDVTSLVGKITGAVSGFMSGVVDAIGLSSLQSLAGNAFLDFPETWQSSVAQMPSSNYSMTLRCPYGNPIARYMYLYVPLCMILGGVIPLATGPASYTSPFLCEMYCKSRAQIRLGMISDLQVTRGGGNIPFGVDDGPLQIDITFTVKDLSSLMYMAIAPSANPIAGIAAGAINAVGDAIGGNGTTGDSDLASISANTYSDDTTFTDYMAVLGGLSLKDQVYASQKWRLNMAKSMLNLESSRSPGSLMALGVGTLPGRLLQAVASYTNRP
jgi:hypothetical protein